MGLDIVMESLKPVVKLKNMCEAGMVAHAFKPALRRQRQSDLCEVEASLGYDFQASWGYWETVSQETNISEIYPFPFFLPSFPFLLISFLLFFSLKISLESDSFYLDFMKGVIEISLKGMVVKLNLLRWMPLSKKRGSASSPREKGAQSRLFL